MAITEIETYTGQLVDLALPDPLTIRVEDIAWHLSRIPRFIGATRSDLVYNVGQHSVLVLNRVRSVVPREKQTPSLLISALFHDAHEYVMGDVPHPAGQLLDMKAPLQRLKHRVQKAIYTGLFGNLRFNGKRFVAYRGDEIHQADLWARSYEAYHLMHSRGKHYAGRVDLEDSEILRNFIVWTPEQSYSNFLRYHHELLLLAD